MGTIAGSSAFLLITGVLIYLYCLRRESRLSRRPAGVQTYAFAKGISYKDLSPAKASSIDSWRKNAVPDTPSSGSGSSSASGYKVYAAHGQPGSGHVVHSPGKSPGRTPPPEYPDYLPYRGPIETRPPTPPSAGYEPPAIAGLNARTQGWLAAASAANSPMTAGKNSTASTPRSNRQVHRPEPIPLRERGSVLMADLVDFPLDGGYYARQDGISPASALSSFGQMTSLAAGATRSVAGLFAPGTTGTATTLPTARSSTSPLSGTMASTSPGRTGSIDTTPTRPLRPKRPERVLSSDSMAYAPTYALAGYLAQSPEQLIGAGLLAGAGAQGWREHDRNPDQDHRSPSRSSEANPSSSPLRRGVSIKSATTMRSFFSGLLWNASTPDTPAVPGWHDTVPAWGSGASQLEAQAARPDSDTFPASVSRSGSISRWGSRDAPLPPLPNSALGSITSSAGAGGRTESGTAAQGSVGTAPTPTTTAVSSASGGKRDRSTSGRTSFVSVGIPPLLRLDTGGENIFIELNPNSPSTMVGMESARSSEVHGVPSSWRYGEKI